MIVAKSVTPLRGNERQRCRDAKKPGIDTEEATGNRITIHLITCSPYNLKSPPPLSKKKVSGYYIKDGD